ncbi:MAG: SUMF1/EgtB/PvdO family nonheme iron enzyme [Planctomycetes bacterium]|nr:SUMF1/EgtB/PvdO family nonheme iron enzyme [Planctomycetota bacterium]
MPPAPDPDSRPAPAREPATLPLTGLPARGAATEAAAAAHRMPEWIGEYRVLRCLGVGGIGVVYLAEQPNPRRAVAVKVLRDDAVTPEALRRFSREAEILARLSHPGIVRVVHAGQAGIAGRDRPYYVMEYVAGRPLHVHAAAARLDLRGRVRLLAQVCDAVAAAHAAGIVHRDLKPANVLVDETGTPRVIDFGVACLQDGSRDTLHTRAGELLGTLSYMAPEQVSAGHGAPGPYTDVHALGAVLYEVLTGRPPFPSEDRPLPEQVRLVADVDPAPLSTHDVSLSGDLETIVAKCLEKDPRRRYRDAGALAADLRAWLEHRPIQARPTTLVYQLRKFMRRHRAFSVAIAVAFLSLLGGLAASLVALDRAWRAEERSERLIWDLRAVEAKARERGDVVLGLADLHRLRAMRTQSASLWPADSSQVSALRRWLADARTLAARLPVHEQQVLQIEAQILAAGPEEADELEWLLGQQRSLVGELRSFLREGEPRVTSASTTLGDVEHRYEFARTLWARTIAGQRAAWDAAIEAIAASPRYHGLRLRPQEGLVPLGPDPRSGLWEFWLADLTGPCPVRDPDTGRLRLEEGSGLVLVLVPGGRFWYGAQAHDPRGVNHDPLARADEGPPRELELEPFLIGKFELTQAQWQAFTGRLPARHRRGQAVEGDTAVVTGRHPVEGVAWYEFASILGKLGLALPTEAQWEYAAAAGDPDASTHGATGVARAEAGNFLTEPVDGGRAGPAVGKRPVGDEFRVHAPVGSFAANGYGLHDVLGNVQEACADPFWPVREPFLLRPGDLLLLGPRPPEKLRCVRGGSWADRPEDARLWRRTAVQERDLGPRLGARPVRSLHR